MYVALIQEFALQVIFEGLANYEKNATASSASLFGTLMMLKAACVSNPGYVDRLVIPFVRVVQRMAREHLDAATSADVTPGNCHAAVY